MPIGFESNVQVYTWGAGGGSGYNGPAGGGGGFAQGIVTMSSGNTVIISVGGQGTSGSYTGSAGGGIGDNPAISFNGGSSGVSSPYPGGDDQYIGAGGGGGAATAVLINGVPMIVAAGGGGGGGGSNYQTGTVGSAGGVATAVNSAARGANSGNGYATGGGGGGGYPYGGGAGASVGDDAGGPGGGYGGQNYANASVASTSLLAGSGTVGAGLTQKLTYSIPRSTGNAGYPGYAVLVFTRGLLVKTKVAGTWTSANKIYYKSDTPVSLSNIATQSFSTVGTNNFTVPAGVLSVNITYITPSGMVTKPFSVTPGEKLAINLGNFGIASSIVGTAGTLTLPAYDTQVFSYSGNVDHIIAQDVQVATATPTSYSGSGSNGTLTAGAAAAGITYNVTYEGWHGDLGATISITPVLISTLLQPIQVYVKSGGGRQVPSAHTYQQQPSASNGYIMNDYQGDYYGGEGGYSWTTNLQQQGYVTLDWQQPYLQSGWINVGQIYYKDGSNWNPLLGNSTINLNKIS